jgi:hypothetical protein
MKLDINPEWPTLITYHHGGKEERRAVAISPPDLLCLSLPATPRSKRRSGHREVASGCDGYVADQLEHVAGDVPKAVNA